MRWCIPIVLAGCATLDYAYAPRGATYDVLVLELPAEAPTGRVMLSSLGVLELAPQAGASTSVLHVRIVVHDARDAVWTFDTGAQRVIYPGGATSRAMFVNADVRELPIATIPRGERRVFDFYFEHEHATQLEPESFDLEWQITTPTRHVAQRTTFSRREVDTHVPRIATNRYWRYQVTHPWPVYLTTPPGATTHAPQITAP